jgi:EAL domain-containing protein (putative c-di-GMP-specific phosphodiesterase class I)
MLDETGLIKDTTLWLLNEASGMFKRFDDMGRRELKLSINLTARMLQDEEFSSKLLKYLVEKKSDPSRLVIELTEDALADYFEDANDTLQALGTLGVQVAIDDFGTGQSSLDHLRSYRFDMVKIDHSYVSDLTVDEGDASLVTAIIKMGHAFRMQVVAEGVETEEQLRYLSENGCDLMQGYLLSRPVSEKDALEYVDNHQGDRKPDLGLIS